MPPGLRYAVRKRKNLTPAEIADIIHKVVVGHQLQKDVAREHRLKPVLVCRLAMKAKKNPRYIGEILGARDDTAAHRAAIVEAVAEMNHHDVVVDSVSAVKKCLKDGYDLEAKETVIRSVMKKDLGMRYRKILSVSSTGNTPKNLVLRQQFALKLIEALAAGKTVINVDET